MDQEHDRIWEIGLVKFDLPPFPGTDPDEAGVITRWSTLVNPEQDLSLKIEELTGTTNDELQDAPDFSQVLPQLRELLADSTIVGHSIGVDIGFLYAHGFILDNQSIDTFEIASILMPGQSRYSLASLSKSLGIEVPVSHRALEDAETSRALFLALYQIGCNLPPHVLMEINHLAAHSRWSLLSLFQEFERRAAVMDSRAPRSLPPLPGGEADPLLVALSDERPLQPQDPPQPIDADRLAALLQPQGAMASHLPNYEHRAPQVEMLQAVAEAFNKEEHLLVEAGTGTGKSLAYLTPAIQYATTNDARVVISTNTINLQDQLWTKDLPLLSRLSRKDFRVAILKGRSNYLCPRRLDQLRSSRNLTEDEISVLAKILVWLPNTQTGDQTELFLPSARDWAVWTKVAVDPDGCTTERCLREQHGRCFFYQARRRAERAHLIVVNHALLLADVATENRVLPEYQHLIVDEAHYLETAVTDQLSFTADRGSVAVLLASLHPPGTSAPGGLLGDIVTHAKSALPTDAFSFVESMVRRCQRAVDLSFSRIGAFFDEVADFVIHHSDNPHPEGYDQRMRIIPATRSQPAWSQVEVVWDNTAVYLSRVSKSARNLCSALGDLNTYDIENLEGLLTDLEAIATKVDRLREEIGALTQMPSNQDIYWIELGSRKERVTLRVAPLHVGPLLEEHLWQQKSTIILTSATLRTAESFDFITDRLNANHARTLTVGSPFDYKASTLICLPSDIPEPNNHGYQQMVERILVELCKATRGRTLTLFTSYSQLRRTSQAITPLLTDDGIVVYEQGDGSSRRQLLENFSTTERAVLLGTRSFWEGVDVVGDALSCLVIVRLPFTVPSDPIFAARSESMESPFTQYAIPDAILRFRQGFGRLIRSKSDRGVVVVLDRRVQSKFYGQLFLASLPTCTVQNVPWRSIPHLASRWIDQVSQA